VYNWSFYGQAPTAYHHDRHGSHELLWPDGRKEGWPGTAFVPVTGFSWEERRQLEEAASLLAQQTAGSRYRNDHIAALKRLAERPCRAPYVLSRSLWPRREHLQESRAEKYLLHRWLLRRDRGGDMTIATPVWLVVTEAAEDKYSHQWRVVRDNICIRCGESVTEADLRRPVEEQRPWQTAHGHCREMWGAHNWRPALFAPD